LKYKIGQ